MAVQDTKGKTENESSEIIILLHWKSEKGAY